MHPWYKISDENSIETPSLLLYPDRIKDNIKRMVAIAGNPERLWPHVKSHKIAEIIQFQLDQNIRNFKCSTIAEAEMVASCGVSGILLAYPISKSTVDRFIKLINKFPDTNWFALSDSEVSIMELNQKAGDAEVNISVFLDLNVGMDRTGIVPGQEALELYKMIKSSSTLLNAGLHLYDGHIHQNELADREAAVQNDYIKANDFIEKLKQNDLQIPHLIAGGTPTFPIHAKNPNFKLSPGTSLLWDYGYASAFTDLKFEYAAVLVTRVVSKPGPNRLCLDLGHKAVASEMPHPRVYFPEIENFEAETHSEEHLVIKTAQADSWNIGDLVYAIPVHICPTTALHETVQVVEKNEIIGQWKVVARKRHITI